MPAPTEYRGTITREQWLLNETRTVARLRLDEGISSPAELVAHVLEHDSFCYPTQKEQPSIARACWRRLDALSLEPALRRHLMTLIAHGTSDQTKQANLYALMCDNRIVWDFALCVLAPKFRTYSTVLRRHEIEEFIAGLRLQSKRASTWSDATLNKIRQVLSTCMEQCGMYDRKTEVLNPLLLDYEIEDAIRANGDGAILPGLGTLD